MIHQRFKTIVPLLCSLILSGCFLGPYEPDVQQGNIITVKDVNKIRKGMTTVQVVSRLGTPVLTNVYADGRLIYIYTLRHRQKTTRRHLIIYFRNRRVVQVTEDFSGDKTITIPSP